MRDRRGFLTIASACLATGLAGCSGEEPSTGQQEPGSDPNSETEPETGSETEPETESETEPETESETEPEPDNDGRCELSPVGVAEEWFAALESADTERVNELSHPQSRVYQDIGSAWSVDTIEQVSEEEATTGEQSAPEVDITGVEEVLADGMAEDVQWLVVTFLEEDGNFYVPMLQLEGCWYYYERRFE